MTGAIFGSFRKSAEMNVLIMRCACKDAHITLAARLDGLSISERSAPTDLT